MTREIKYALFQMLQDLMENRLVVQLIPQSLPVNCGAKLRIVTSRNCDWYREFCSEFESKRKTRSRKFKTKVKRQRIIELLKKMAAGEHVKSMYSIPLLRYAEDQLDRILNM